MSQSRWSSWMKSISRFGRLGHNGSERRKPVFLRTRNPQLEPLEQRQMLTIVGPFGDLLPDDFVSAAVYRTTDTNAETYNVPSNGATQFDTSPFDPPQRVAKEPVEAFVGPLEPFEGPIYQPMAGGGTPQTYTVTSLADDGGGELLTLREALALANSSYDTADTIVFASSLFDDGQGGSVAGVITLASELSITDAVTIIGPGAELLTIDANADSDDDPETWGGAGANRRAFSISVSYGAVSFSDMTITGGATTADGGAMYVGCYGTSLSLDGCVISGNMAQGNGGGIYSIGYPGALTVANSRINDNSSQGSGGGIWAVSGTIASSTVSGNTASDDGGGIFMSAGWSASVSQSIISGNAAGGDGGGIWGLGEGTITDAIITSNTAGDDGGGVFLPSNGTGRGTISSSIISGNTVGGDGGGLYAEGNATIRNSAFSANVAGGDGGAIWAGSDLDTYSIVNSTIAGNVATSSSGGIHCPEDGSTNIINSIVALNEATSNANLAGPYSDSYSLIGTDPDFVRNPNSGADQTWGTADDDHGDLRLLPGSEAINAGDNGAALGIDYDLDGNPRIGDDIVDMGAYEYYYLAEGGDGGLAFSDGGEIGEDEPYTVELTIPSAPGPSFWVLDWGDGDHFKVTSPNWGSGVVQTSDTTWEATHTYADAGEYTFRATSVPGDANFDGVVDAIDASILAAHWGRTNVTWAQGDFNADGVVNALDSAILAAQWGVHSYGGSHAVTVLGATPQLRLLGSDIVDVGAIYPLTLGDFLDPGLADAVTLYTVHWGDGNTDTYTAAAIKTLDRQVTHGYSSPPGTQHTIRVDLTVNETTWLDAATKNVVISTRSLTWDPDGVNDSNFGGSGRWTAEYAWVDMTTDPPTRYTWDDSLTDYRAVFSGTAGTVEIRASISIAGIMFDTPGYTIGDSAMDGELVLAPSGCDITTVEGAATINSVLVGSGGVAKHAIGTLMLVGSHRPVFLAERLPLLGDAGDCNGTRVAVSGDTILVGGPWGGESGEGWVQVLVNSGGEWQYQTTLSHSGADRFGAGVAIDGTRAVVGAPGSSTAYVYTGAASVWTLDAQMQGTGGFGFDVKVAGNMAVIGMEDGSSAHVFTSDDDWASGSTLGSGTYFGHSVAISDTRAVVGDYWTNTVYFYRYDAGYWVFDGSVSRGDGNDQFGHSVAISGDYAIVGANTIGSGGFFDTGSATIYRREADSTWVEQITLAPGELRTNDQFGYSVAISGDFAAIGAINQGPLGRRAGSVYVYERVGTTWELIDTLRPEDGTNGDQFGCSVAIDGNKIVIGAQYEDIDDYENDNAGAAYVFTLASPPYSGGTTVYSGTLSFTDGALGTEGNIVFNGNSTLQWLSGNTEDISGRLVIDDNVVATFDVGDNNVTFADGFGADSSGSIVKAGAGTLALAGTGTYGGQTTISQGELSVTGSIASSSVLIDGGTLSGTGTTGNVTADGGSISPGAAGVGTLNTGNLELASGSTYQATLSDLRCDRIDVVGTVNLADATLGVTSTRADMVGDVVILLNNDGADSITGTFLGLPEGAHVDAGPARYSITYRYNAETGEPATGNDVALINCRPAAPSGLSATATFEEQIDLNWTDASDDETGFEIDRATNSTFTIGLMTFTAEEDATSFTDTALTLGTIYYYRVRAINGDLESPNSNVASEQARLAKPTEITATALSHAEVRLDWTDNSNNESGYMVERMTAGASWPAIATLDANATSYTDTAGLTEGSAYYYRVRATVGSLTSYHSGMIHAITLPAAPENLEATIPDGGQATLTWDDYSAVEVGYAIDQWIDDDWHEIATAAPGTGVMGLTIGGAFEPSTDHDFRVRAYIVDFSGNRLYSLASTDTVTTAAWPSAPTGLIATAISDTQIDLAWTDASGETGYKIERSEDGVTGWTQIGTATADAAAYSDTSVTEGEGTLRYYRLRATKTGVGDSGYTDVGSATTLPATPGTLLGTIIDGGRVDLTWDDHSAIETAYLVEQWIDDEWYGVQWGDVDAESMTFFGTFEPTVQYTFRVRAYTETEYDYAYSAPSNEATVTALGWPAAPTELATTVVSNTEIALAWTDNAFGETYYQIDRTTDGEIWTVVTDTLPPNTQGYSDTGLTDGTLYGYRVRAVNGVGGSGHAYNAAATLPTAPTGLQATVVSGTQIDLSWTAADYATGYTIWRLAEDSDTWELVDDTVPSSQTTYSVTGLTPGGMYYAFCVAPTNSTAGSAVAYLDPPTLNASPIITSVTTNNMTLSVDAHDDRGESNLTYSWSILAAPNCDSAYFIPNDSNDAKTTTVTFYVAGSYTFQITVTDAAGDSVADTVLVTVEQTLTSIAVTPGDAAVLQGATRQFAASGIDQFGNDMASQPSFTWSVDAGGVGTVDVGGLYTAPSGGDAPTITIRASVEDKSGTANVAVKKSDDGIIDFDSTGYPYPGVTFAAGSGQTLVVGRLRTSESGTTGSNIIYAGTQYNCPHGCSRSDGVGDITISFDDPRAILSFDVVGRLNATVCQGAGSGTYSVGTLKVHTVGGQIETVNMEADGDAAQVTQSCGYFGTQETVAFSGTISLAQYGLVTKLEIIDVPRIEFQNVYGSGGSGGPTWCHHWIGHQEFGIDNIQFRSESLLELTVVEHGSTINKTTAITDYALKDLYVTEDPTAHTAGIDISLLFDPSTNETKKDIRLRIARNDGMILFDDEVTDLASYQALPVTDQWRIFGLLAWLDSDGDGQWSSNEPTRFVRVHVISLRIDNNGNGVIDKTDDALNLVQPTAVNLEGNGQRTKVILEIGSPCGDGVDYKAILRHVPGLEFWTAAQGGTKLTPNAKGNLIETDFTGQFACTLWVSTASATMLSVVGGAPGGATGDMMIKLLVKDKHDRTITHTSVQVNEPVQVLYAVDGTNCTAADNNNVRQFEQRYQGVAGTDRHYYAGPQSAVTGADSPAIVTNVANRIQADYATAMQLHRQLVIDIVGFSRGAVIAATVARDLNNVGFAIGGVTYQQIDVHWVGLFDAVSMMGRDVHPPHYNSQTRANDWATVFTANIHSPDHLIHTATGFWSSPIQRNVFPTVMTFVPTTPFNLANGRQSTHSDVGNNVGALQWMIRRARAAGVPVR